MPGAVSFAVAPSGGLAVDEAPAAVERLAAVDVAAGVMLPAGVDVLAAPGLAGVEATELVFAAELWLLLLLPHAASPHTATAATSAARAVARPASRMATVPGFRQAASAIRDRALDVP